VEVIKKVLESYKLLLDVGPKIMELDEEIFRRLESATGDLAYALTMMRMRLKLDPETEKMIESVLEYISGYRNKIHDKN